MKVVYGHTDSIYIQVPDVQKATEVCNTLNDYVQDIFPNVLGLEPHPVQLEFEKFYSGFGVGTTKNRNAGFLKWKDGKYLEEEEFVATGFSMKRISASPISRKFQTDMLKMWANQEKEHVMVDIGNKLYNKIAKGKVPISDIIRRGRIKRELEEYKSIAGGIAGVCYYNQHINPMNPIIDSYIYIQCAQINGPQYVLLPNGKERKASYVSFKEIKELTDDYIIDWHIYAENIVIKKAKPIFDAMGWDMNRLRKDENQLELHRWIV